LPKKEFYEAELRELLTTVIEAFKEAMGKGEVQKVKLPKIKTLIR
jgi:hypothetical protein